MRVMIDTNVFLSALFLYSAITEDVDVFVTGDKNFDGLGLERPEIISPAGFLEKY